MSQHTFSGKSFRNWVDLESPGRPMMTNRSKALWWAERDDVGNQLLYLRSTLVPSGFLKAAVYCRIPVGRTRG